jgi:hypothetical protein
VRYRPGGTTCATGGTCAVGDIGPGGGIVFITPSTVGGNGRFFEAAPFTWAGVDDLSTNATYCSNHNSNIGSTNVGIGWGETNTNMAKSACLGGAVAIVNNFNQSNNTGYSNWFIPSTNEMIELAKLRNQAGLLKIGNKWTVGRYGYWTSTESSASGQASLVTSSWNIGVTNKNDANSNLIRPVRMFTPCNSVDSCSSQSFTAKPIDAGTYWINAETLTLTTGDLANYAAIRYETTTVTINRISQIAQQLPFNNPTYPSSMIFYIGGGSGTGATAYSLLGGGNATGCTFDYKNLSTTSIGTCQVQVVKSADRNYLADTATAFIYFIEFVINQPAPAVGSGPTIALSGATSVTLDSNVAPTITAVTFVPFYCSMGMCTPDHWQISGAGFGAMGNTNTIVKFWRNKVVVWEDIAYTTNYVVSDNVIRIQNVPAGATTGKITVTTANGIAVSPDNWVAP